MTEELYLPSIDDVCRHLTLLRDAELLPPQTLLMLVADFLGYARVGMFVDQVPAAPAPRERTHSLEGALRGLDAAVALHGAVLAISRTGRPAVSEDDLQWREAFTAASANAGTVSHGVYLVTPTIIGQIGGSTSVAA